MSAMRCLISPVFSPKPYFSLSEDVQMLSKITYITFELGGNKCKEIKKWKSFRNRDGINIHSGSDDNETLEHTIHRRRYTCKGNKTFIKVEEWYKMILWWTAR